MPTQKNFYQHVYDNVKRIPRGRVATYGQIAALCGNPRAARAVGWAMHQMDRLPHEEFKKYAWWRVINSQGYISTTCEEHTFEIQKQFLEQEKIEVVRDEKKQMYRVDLDQYLWKP